MYWPRGKTLGGSSSINAMLYVRGHAWDYDHWRQLGNAGWSYDDVLPYFKKAENNERGGDEFHGTGGPLNVADQRRSAEINDAFLEAGEQAGHKRNDDFNGAEQDGVGFYQVTQKRPGSAGAPPAPTCGRRSSATATTSTSSPTRWSSASSSTRTTPWACATWSTAGTRSRAQPRDHPVRRRDELAAAPDAVGHRPGRSPELARHPAAADMPGVGGNLQDHLDAAMLQHCKTRDTYDRANKLWTLYQYMFNKKGPGTSPIAESGGFLRTRQGLARPTSSSTSCRPWWSITAAPR